MVLCESGVGSYPASLGRNPHYKVLTVQIGKNSLDSAERTLPGQTTESEIQIASSGLTNSLKLH